MNTYKENFCAYLRKSRADHDAELRGEGETLTRHKQLLNDFAINNGIKIIKWYCEIVSGDTIEDRPVMQQLLKDVESDMWAGVFVVELERLARGNTKDQGIVADTFKYSGTKIITPIKTYDPNDEFDEEYFEFGLFMSRREYKTINRRLQRGRISSVKEGKFICSTAPYGYRKVKLLHDRGYTLEIIPEQANIVRKIFEWYCHGELLPDNSLHRIGTDAIAARLDALGIKPPVNNFWSKATIADILRNKIYTGYVTFGRQKEIKTSVNGKIIKIRKTNTDYICEKGLHQPIIDERLFELAQVMRKENRKNTLRSSQSLQNPLSGIVYCKKCGKLMTRLGTNSRNKYATLKCPNRYCNNVSSPLFLIEEQILKFMAEWLTSYELNSKTITVIPLHKEIIDKQEIMRKIEVEISGLKNQLNKAYDFLEQGIYTIEIFQNRQQLLTQDIARLQKSLKNISQQIESLKSLQTERELYAPKVRRLIETYQTNSVEMNNQILKEVIDKVYYQKNEPNRKGQLYNANFSLEFYPKVPT